MLLSLESCPALVLNADHRPLSYFPLSLWSWQEAVKAVFLGRVNILSVYDRDIHSPGFTMPLPSVISLKRYIRPAFTRFNVFLRDQFECQYCRSNRDLTFDHVIPRSRGGMTTWENVVAACAPCNLAKGGRLSHQAGMYPRHAPHMPSVHELQENGRAFPPRHLHATWRDYLYWDIELEP